MPHNMQDDWNYIPAVNSVYINITAFKCSSECIKCTDDILYLPKCALNTNVQ